MKPEQPPSRRVVLTALASNTAEGVAKLIGFALTGSVALLAESIHSVADTGNETLLLLGARRSRQIPTSAMPFGRGRERYFWAFVVGLVLFGLGGLVSIGEGLRKLTDPGHSVDHPTAGITLIVVSALFEGWSLRVGSRTARGLLPPGRTLWHRLRQSRNPDVTIVVFEDTASLIGLGLAFGGLVASAVTGDGLYDAVATVAIGVLLCSVAVMLSANTHALLIGRSAVASDLTALAEAIVGTAGVAKILNLRTEHIGPDDLLVCVKVELRPPADLDRVIDVINEIERRVHLAVPATLTCYVEPDRYDPSREVADWT